VQGGRFGRSLPDLDRWRQRGYQTAREGTGRVRRSRDGQGGRVGLARISEEQSTRTFSNLSTRNITPVSSVLYTFSYSTVACSRMPRLAV
jgi:hypothetical protein